jgi:hypothetical protein
LGDVNGQLQAAFTKIASLHAKNGFSLAIVAGNLFSGEDDDVTSLLAGEITIPLPTYFTVGTASLPQPIVEKIERDEEVIRNFFFLCLPFFHLALVFLIYVHLANRRTDLRKSSFPRQA